MTLSRNASTPSRTPLPVPDDRPRGTHVHDAEPKETDDSGDGGDDLRHITDVGEQLLDEFTEIQSGQLLTTSKTDGAGRWEAACAMTLVNSECGVIWHGVRSPNRLTPA